MNSSKLLELICVLCFLELVCCQGDCESRLTCQDCVPASNILRPSRCAWCLLEKKCGPADNITSCYSKSLMCPVEQAKPFNPDDAYENLLLSSLAYGGNPSECISISKQMNDLRKKSGYQIWDSIGVKCDFALDYDDCFAMVAVSEQKIAVVFRGTSSNVQLFEQITHFVSNNAPTFKKVGGTVNAYFKNAFEKMYSCVTSSVKELLATPSKEYDVVVTGHSLGGALAALTAVSLIKDRVTTAERLTLYTYGEPRVGDKEFAYNFNSIVKNSWRIVHALDIVTVLPPGGDDNDSPFHHNTMVYYPNDEMLRDSTYIVCSNYAQDTKCKQSFIRYLMLNHKITMVDVLKTVRCTLNNISSKGGDVVVAVLKCVGKAVDEDVVKKVIKYVEYHLSYFNISVGTHCSSRKKSIASWSFDDSKCMQIPINRPSNLLANLEVKTATSSTCTFDANFCDWSRSNGNWMNWIRHYGPTDIARKTGPDADRFGNNKSYYIFVDASNNAGKTGTIRSANFPIGSYCITFYYHMYGKKYFWDDHTGELRLKLVAHGSKKLIWQRLGNQGNSWQQVSCSIQKTTNFVGELYFEFEAAVGKSYRSDMAIDDISIQPGTCRVINCSIQN